MSDKLVFLRIVNIVTLSILLVHSTTVRVTLHCIEVIVEKDILPERYPERSLNSLPVPCERYTAPQPTFQKQSLLVEAQAARSYQSLSSDSGIQKPQYKDPSSHSHISKLQRKPGNIEYG